MNIKILDSWLREYLKTKATAREIAEKLSLSSVSIERVEKYKNDFIYDIEVTTNRPDLASVAGLAREAAAVLPQAGIQATFVSPKLQNPKIAKQAKIEIANNPKLVNRVCAVVMEVTVKKSPEIIQERLETSGIRSLNNVIDITNYVMRTIGHPAHVFDFDRLNTNKLIIAQSKKGDTIETLDGKKHTLLGGDIVALDDKGRIVDLLGIMGLKNSVITEETKRILYFLDNNDPLRMRKTSMSLAIRSEAAQMNEKGIDPELAHEALLFGIAQFEKIANGKAISDIIDIYPNKPVKKTISIPLKKIDSVIGVTIPEKTSLQILNSLGFRAEKKMDSIEAIVPSSRINDMEIEEDLIEEIARIYGYHGLPSVLPPVTSTITTPPDKDIFYWEHRIKEALKYWGYTEAYTYAMVSEDMFEGPIEDAVTLKNPLAKEFSYMRNTLIPSLLGVIAENKNRETIKIFEIANVYTKNGNALPRETRMLGIILKKPNASFFEIKGLIEQLTKDMGIMQLTWRKARKGGAGADVVIDKKFIGSVEVLDDEVINAELNFEILAEYATLKKMYTPIAKFPPIIEDIAFVINEETSTGDIIKLIKQQDTIIKDVSLLDRYEDTRTFHIVYQDKTKNLTNEEVSKIREKIVGVLQKAFKAELK